MTCLQYRFITGKTGRALSKKIYEVDPLICAPCSGKMKVISVIEDAHITKKTLTCLYLWDIKRKPPPQANTPPAEALIICGAIGDIDLLDIDVEGTELEVWQTFDYDKHKPKVVIIEYYTFGLGDNSEEIKKIFSDLPYQLVHTTCTNFIFLNVDSTQQSTEYQSL